MKKIFLLLILIVLINGCVNQNTREIYKPSICGDNICEEGEEDYCLDCNLSCKSELCNSKINAICDNCTKTEEELLPTLFENQNIAYDYLGDYYGYHPQRLIYHTIVYSNMSDQCYEKEGCYISGGLAERNGVKQGFIPGLKEYGESEITKKKNVGFEIHELAHVFTYYGLGIVPSWFTEGISIYTESRIIYQPNYIFPDKLDSFSGLYESLKTGDTSLDEAAPYDEYYKTKHNNHVIGAMYFGSLEKDYNCDRKCIAKILYSLHGYKENCTGECFEYAKKSYPQLMNISLNNNDLRISIITNSIIKQKSEEVIGKNLTYLFNLLEIEY